MTWPRAGAILVGIVVIAFWRALLDPSVVLGDNYDFLRQFLPQRAFQVSSLARLEFPSWNPLDTMGVPYIASFQPGFFSPSTLPLAALLAVTGAQVTPKIMAAWQIAHLAFAGLGLLLCARLLDLSPWAGLAGGVTYALSGWLVAQSGHVNQQNTAAWIPWAIAGLVHLARAPNPRRLALAAGGVAAVVLCGHPQIAGYGLAVLATVCLWLAGKAARRRGWRDGAGLAAWLAGAGAAGLALTAVQVLPLLQYAGVATRGARGYAYATTYSLPRADTLLLLAPHALGASAHTFRGLTPSMYELYGYAGLLPFVLAPAALLSPRRRVLAWALAAATVGSLLFALGRLGFLYPQVYKVAGPLLERFRNPGRALLGVDLALSFLVALGVDRLARDAPASLRRTLLPCVAAGSAVLLVLAALWRIDRLDGAIPSRRGLALATATALVVVVGLVTLSVVRLPPRARPAVLAALVAFAAADLALATSAAFLVQPAPYRDAAASVFVSNQEGVQPGELPPFRVESDAGTLPLEQNNGSVVGVAKTMGDDSLVFAPYVELRAVLGTLHAQGVQLDLFRTDRLASPLLDLFGAKYLFTTDSPGLLPPAAKAKYVPVLAQQGVWIYENPSAYPLGWLTGAAISPRAPAALEAADLRAVTAVDPSDLRGSPLGQAGPAGTASVVGQGSSWIAFDVEVDGPGAIMATSLVDYPGWQLSVNGRSGQRLRVNHAFRGAWLPPGHHRVEWRFVNRPLRVGLAVSGVTLALLMGLAVPRHPRAEPAVLQ